MKISNKIGSMAFVLSLVIASGALVASASDQLQVQGSGMGVIVISVAGGPGGPAEEIVSIFEKGHAIQDTGSWNTFDGPATRTNYSLGPEGKLRMGASVMKVGTKAPKYEFITETEASETAWRMVQGSPKGSLIYLDAASSKLLFQAMKSSGLGTTQRDLHLLDQTLGLTSITTAISGAWVSCGCMVYVKKTGAVNEDDIAQAEANSPDGWWYCQVRNYQ